MSTKNYNCYKFLGCKDDIVPFLKKISENIIKNINCKKIIKDGLFWCHIVKNSKFEMYTGDFWFWSDVVKKVRQSQSNMGDWNDISANCCVYFYNSNIYFVFFNTNVDFSKFKELEYFGYWDNTDPDEDCSEEEWKEREDFCDNCIVSRFNENALTRELLDEDEIISKFRKAGIDLKKEMDNIIESESEEDRKIRNKKILEYEERKKESGFEEAKNESRYQKCFDIEIECGYKEVKHLLLIEQYIKFKNSLKCEQ